MRSQQAAGGDPAAMIVWFYSLENEKENRNLETGIFADEPTALAMKIFTRIKIDIETVSDPELRRKYGRTPCFVSIDPNGDELEMVKGKSATSRSRFKSFLVKTWTCLYEMKQKAFVKQMTKILDRLDKVSGKKTVLNAKKARLAKRPNAAKQRALAKEEAALTEAETSIQRDEAAVKRSCKLKMSFRAGEPAEK